MATAVPTKGIEGRFGTGKCMEFIEEFGDKGNKIIVKTDQEPSMTFLVKDLIEEREEGKTLQELSPVKSSGSNGLVER